MPQDVGDTCGREHEWGMPNVSSAQDWDHGPLDQATRSA